MSDYTSTMRRRATTSYGILLFTVTPEIGTLGRTIIRYQVQQRRDSISYQEFIKDFIAPQDIPRHITLMSQEERKRCVDYYESNDFTSIWNDLWINHECKLYRYDLERCSSAFSVNMSRYIGQFKSSRGRSENSWGFAKGRKNYTESERECAVREFSEETTIPYRDIQLLDMKPYEEIYTGTDNKPYRTVLYVAYIPYIPNVVEQHNTNPHIIRPLYISEEVSSLEWWTYEDCMSRLDVYKKNIIRDVNRHLLHNRRARHPHLTRVEY